MTDTDMKRKETVVPCPWSDLSDAERYMRRCLQLAAQGRLNAKPNPMVGAVIVADGRIIGEGYHVRCGEGHAEVNAFASVRREDEALLPQSTIYVSLEPCSHYGKTPPCADLIVRKGVRRCVVGCLDPFAEVQGRGVAKLRAAGIEVTVGVLEAECKELNKCFFTFHREHRPYIILKWAQTADGYIDNHFQPLAVSTPFTRMLVHQLRSQVDAIVVGRVTDEREHPRLDVRYWSGRNPLRLVVDRHHPLQMESLYAQHVQSLLVEGGRQALLSFLDAGLWDELRVETASMTVGGGTSAPPIPAGAVVHRVEDYDGNRIIHYRRG